MLEKMRLISYIYTDRANYTTEVLSQQSKSNQQNLQGNHQNQPTLAATHADI